ncbi:hypothetical protein HF086_010938, partial [Spodoptera exigua]
MWIWMGAAGPGELAFIPGRAWPHVWRVVVQIKTVPWPSRSPDLNPIENVWGLMVRK